MKIDSYCPPPRLTKHPNWGLVSSFSAEEPPLVLLTLVLIQSPLVPLTLVLIQSPLAPLRLVLIQSPLALM
jgi:hypothetical protein